MNSYFLPYKAELQPNGLWSHSLLPHKRQISGNNYVERHIYDEIAHVIT